jgi:hypothetical protein
MGAILQEDQKPSTWLDHLREVFRLIVAWPIATGIIGSILVGLSVYSTRQDYQLNPAETAAAALGYLAAWSFLKASWLATFYRVVFGKKFEGSCFKLAALINLLLVISELTIAYVGYSRSFAFPFEQLPFILALFYVCFTLFFWLAFVSFGRGLWWDGRSIQWPR